MNLKGISSSGHFFLSAKTNILKQIRSKISVIHIQLNTNQDVGEMEEKMSENVNKSLNVARSTSMQTTTDYALHTSIWEIDEEPVLVCTHT